MRSFFLFLVISFVAISVNAQVMRQADSLIALGKYQSAYKLLDSKDPKNAKPEIVIKKIEVLTKYYIVQAVIWDINPFDQWGVELGKELASRLAPIVADAGAATTGLDGSTAGLVGIMRGLQRG